MTQDIKSEGMETLSPIKKRNKGNLFQFAIFLFLSFIFWYLSELGENFTVDVRYPIAFENTPDAFDSEHMPQRVNLDLEGRGFSMMKFKMSGKANPYVINFNQIHYSKSSVGQKGDYFILTSRLVTPMTEQLKPPCKIVSVKPDTLFFVREPDPQIP